MENSHKKNEKLTAQIIKLVFGGQGFARIENPASPHDGKPAFIWNALPGEDVEFQVTKAKKNFVEGIVTKVIKSSPKRIEPKEDHFSSCSPFQVLEYKEENKQKVEMCREVFGRIGKIPDGSPTLETLEIVAPKEEYGYRNKIEYNFKEDEKGQTKLAFFERNQLVKTPIEPCILANSEINKVAELILVFMHENKLTSGDVKSTIIRSNQKGEVIAALFFKNNKDLKQMEAIPELSDTLKGFHIYLYDHRNVLYTEGQDFLVQEVKGTELKYGLNSFFQVNQEVFEEALGEVETQLSLHSESTTKNDGPINSQAQEGRKELPDLLDLYSGVGAIGLPLYKKCKSVTLVDSNREAIKFAKENIALNKITNATARCSEAEKHLEIITADKVVILDPPRAGIHEKLIQKLIKEQPPMIIYLSCNASTQARDIKLLSEKYTVKHLKLFNFFPRTPHVESLCVLEKTAA